MAVALPVQQYLRFVIRKFSNSSISRTLSGISSASTQFRLATVAQQPATDHKSPRPPSPPVIKPQVFRSNKPYELYKHDAPFKMHLGGELPSFEIAYESWGKMNERKDNVILLTTGMSDSSHAKSHYGNRQDGWWEKFIGPGLPLDTEKFHIICTNSLGGCYGSTGPASINPATGNRYATDFPLVTVWDIARTQFRLLDSLGVERAHAVVGSSMGGMTSLAVAALYPHRVGRIVSISAAARSHPYSIALRHAQRQVLMSDINWKDGKYYDGEPPQKGLNLTREFIPQLARQIGTITYRSGPEWEIRFGRKRVDPKSKQGLSTDFMIESYLDHQGKKWRYDANSFLYLSRAMDMFDMSDRLDFDTNNDTKHILHESVHNFRDKEDKNVTDYTHTHHLTKGMSTIKCPVLVIGVKSDFLIPSWQQKEIATCLKAAGNNMVTHFEIDGVYGHDTFLLDFSNIGSAVKGHLEIDFEDSLIPIFNSFSRFDIGNGADAFGRPDNIFGASLQQAERDGAKDV
ncbi:hypothetical protein HK100_010442 [Physocladia obscura]|uniref:AB hydrolase-1 domain-containing protein n=1 Tax=Physocladia obscura TaxID=109957 RepID=A0AAD5T2C3_9FUNG|nr:hypothetical protein HK100_010442 [Physocladia obscura]